MIQESSSSQQLDLIFTVVDQCDSIDLAVSTNQSNYILTAGFTVTYVINSSNDIVHYWNLIDMLLDPGLITPSIADDCGAYSAPVLTLSDGTLVSTLPHFTIELNNSLFRMSTTDVTHIGTFEVLLSTYLVDYPDRKIEDVPLRTIIIEDRSV